MALTTTANVKEFLRISGSGDDTLIGNLITRAQAAIETYCDRAFDEATYREWINGRNEEPLPLDHYPVSSVKRVAYGVQTAFTVSATTSTDLRATVEVQDAKIVLSRFASDGTETATDVTFASNATVADVVSTINSTSGWSATQENNWISLDLHRLGGSDAITQSVSVTYPSESDLEYRVDESSGLITLVWSSNLGWPGWGEDFGEWPRGFQNVLVHYTAGYASGSIPADLEQACIEVVADMYSETERDRGLASESLGDYSYSAIDPATFAERFGNRLAQWRDRRS